MNGTGNRRMPRNTALYIHWPFCKAKCPYCDFNSHVRAKIDQARWRSALLRELDHAAGEATTTNSDDGGIKRRMTSIFFGGGTPSLMAPETVAALIERAKSLFDVDPDGLEITLEANPTSVEAGSFPAYRDAGVNRVSLGLQALDDATLRFLGREHSTAEALAALERAKSAFTRVSFDLIYARPEQSPAEWRDELRRALDLAGSHLSLYQLTIEPGTAFHTRAKLGERMTAEEEQAAALYEEVQDTCSAVGLPAYEISNHARPGAESRHNLTYWRYGDYIGIGPGAHGRIGKADRRFATRRRRLPERWLTAVESSGHGLEETTEIPPSAQFQEAVLMGLRLAEGVTDRALRERTGRGLDAISEQRRTDLIEEGYLADTPGCLTATRSGRQRLNAVLDYLLNDG